MTDGDQTVFQAETCAARRQFGEAGAMFEIDIWFVLAIVHLFNSETYSIMISR
jgi:hypothetical protein